MRVVCPVLFCLYGYRGQRNLLSPPSRDLISFNFSCVIAGKDKGLAHPVRFNERKATKTQPLLIQSLLLFQPFNSNKMPMK